MVNINYLLRDFSDNELEIELKRRKEEAGKPPKPRIFNNINDFDKVIKMTINYVDRMARDKCEDIEYEKDIFGELLEVVYGVEYYAWRDRQSW